MSIHLSPIAIATGLSIIAVIMLVADSLIGTQQRISRRVKEEQKRMLRARVSQSRLFKDWSNSRSQPHADSEPSLQERLHRYLEQSGLNLSIRDLTRRSIISGVIFASVAVLTTNLLVISTAVLAGVSAPWVLLFVSRRKRLNQLRDQLPETFEMIRRAMQAGQTIQNALTNVARQCSSPISEEFSYCCEQQNLGLPYEWTLRDLGTRSGLVELQMFSVAMILQRQAGGNPIEVLDNLAETVRKRTKLAMRVQAVTAEGRMQALVLSLLPLMAFAGIYMLAPEYVSVLMDYPRLLAGLVLSVLLGVVWIRRIVHFDY